MKRVQLWTLALVLIGTGTLWAQGKNIAGNWQGTLRPGDGEGLRIVLKITGDDGKYRGQLYSIDQGPGAMAMSSISLQGSEVIFAIKVNRPDLQGHAEPGRQHDLRQLNARQADAPSKPAACVRGGHLGDSRADEADGEGCQPDFEVATIKPSKPNTPGKTTDFEGRHFTMVNYNMNDLLSDAYGMHTKQILGAPAWFDTELYDIDGVPDVPGEPNDKQAGMMLQKLLADRFALKVHLELRELSVFAITVAKGGRG